MISWRKCKDIALSIFIKVTLIIQMIFWTAIICDNAMVAFLNLFEPLYENWLQNSNSKYEPIMKNKLVIFRNSVLQNPLQTLAAKLSCSFKVPVLEADCNFKIPALVPIITINVCLIIFTLMPKSFLKYWKWADDKEVLTFIVYLSVVTVSSLHLITYLTDFFLLNSNNLVVSVRRWRFRFS